MSGMISATEMNSRYKKQDNRHRCQTRNADAVLVRYIRNSQDRCYAEGGDQAVITDPDIIATIDKIEELVTTLRKRIVRKDIYEAWAI